MNGYELSRRFWDYAFENPEKISPNHAAIYFFAIEHCNRLGWKDKYGFPTSMAMDAVGIKNYHTYVRYFNDLVDWGFIELVQKSKNQYSSNIISLYGAMSKNSKAYIKADNKALDKALARHTAKQLAKQDHYIKTIEPLNNITIKQEGEQENCSPEFEKIVLIFKNKNCYDPEAEALKFYNHYKARDWKFTGGAEIRNFEAAVESWIIKMEEFNNKKQTNGRSSNIRPSGYAESIANADRIIESIARGQ